MKIKTFLLLILIICNTILISSCRKKCENHFDNNNDYICDTCQELIDNDNYYSSNINTIANDIFFPIKKNTLHQEEILNIYKNKYNNLMDPQIYNLTPEEKSMFPLYKSTRICTFSVKNSSPANCITTFLPF